MDNKQAARFFLGANSPGGFYSLYDGFTDTERDHLYILKGGPGCGKSTFMKKLGAAAESEGYFVEYIHCSGDPESLDGVYVPKLNTAYVDGTSPHVIEPAFAGSQASYVNMGAFYDPVELASRREAIAELTGRYKGHYARAFGLLGAVKALGGARPSEEALAAAEKRGRGLIRREIRGHGNGKTVKRFLSAYTCLGYMAYFDTVEALADRVFVLDNDLGLGYAVIEAAAREAESRGLMAVRCQWPLRPEVTEHLILPELGLALVSGTSELEYTGKMTRHMRLDAIPGKEELTELKPELKRLSKLRRALTEEAVSALQDAKAAHDELEEQYIPTVDFAGLDRLAERHIGALIDRRLQF